MQTFLSQRSVLWHAANLRVLRERKNLVVMRLYRQNRGGNSVFIRSQCCHCFLAMLPLFLGGGGVREEGGDGGEGGGEEGGEGEGVEEE